MPIQKTAQALCPESRPSETEQKLGATVGELKRSIRITTRVDINLGTATATIKAGNKKAFTAHMVEFGTLPHLIEAGSGSLNKAAKKNALDINGLYVDKVHHPGATAKPFMRPAADEAKEAAVDALAASLGEQIERLATEAD